MEHVDLHRLQMSVNHQTSVRNFSVRLKGKARTSAVTQNDRSASDGYYELLQFPITLWEMVVVYECLLLKTELNLFRIIKIIIITC